MTDATIAITILWVFLFIYSLLGSVDFGAGFWSMLFGRDSNDKDARAAVVANNFLSPSWKVTNTFLVLFVVALVGFFPGATYSLASLLLVPVCLVLVLLTIRSAFMVYAYSVSKYGRTLRIISGITGLLIPGLLVGVLAVTLGGFVEELPDGGLALDYGALLKSPTLYAHLAFGYATELFFSALFLADYAQEAHDASTYRVYRRLAVIFGPLNLLTALLVTWSMPVEASWLVENLKHEMLWFLLSIAAFAVGYVFLFVKRADGSIGRTRITVICVAIQYAIASFAYGRAHLPYILYPYVTLESGITNPAMFRSLLIGYTVSTILLIPVFILFWKLFLKDKRYLKQE
ncbi:cytochrome d ubiquinol oxidase subunit II [Paenibacillus taiwanensis]|uniref:cytochrome d ubiquinol oxidase subunit II n=1 Tax=Paenibacillus taiwanensis TaxID=401638 RepID=UPI0004255010|nr:cytochrome d ubiquinol oxidase subunit II [Paenibacillus taiwanensis]